MVIHWVNKSKKASIGDLKLYDCGKLLFELTIRFVESLRYLARSHGTSYTLRG